MNIAKNMEAIFVFALILAGATNVATAAIPAYHSEAAAAIASASSTSNIPTVTVTAKRLTAEQKAAL